MADEQEERQGGSPAGLAVLVLVGLLVAGYHLFAPKAQAQPTVSASSCTAGECADAQGWMAPVDAPLWGGFRTPDNPSHDGVDLGAARGTPIRAAASGRVVRVRCDVEASYGCDRDGSARIHGCGWYVDVRHAGDVYTRYCHMREQPQVVVEQAVNVGQILGHVGSSGNSSAPHLHFEVHQGDQSSATAVDPVLFMVQHGASLG